jgi:signal transduction protein with GAF and PtsI domain
LLCGNYEGGGTIMTPQADITERLGALLQDDGEREDRLQAAIEEIAQEFDARTCTFHRAAAGDQLLELVAQVGLPPHIAQIAGRIPFGKGMAGVCAQRREPVTMCNLQTDDSGVANPAARDTRVEGAVVVPLLAEDRVIATLGIGKGEEYDYSEEEIHTLQRCATALIAALP